MGDTKIDKIAEESQKNLLRLKRNGLILVAIAFKNAVFDKDNESLPPILKNFFSLNDENTLFKSLCLVLLDETESKIIQECWYEIEIIPIGWIKKEFLELEHVSDRTYFLVEDENVYYDMGMLFTPENKFYLIKRILEESSFLKQLKEKIKFGEVFLSEFF